MIVNFQFPQNCVISILSHHILFLKKLFWPCLPWIYFNIDALGAGKYRCPAKF